MTDNTTENPVQADINDVLDNMTTQPARRASWPSARRRP